MKDLSSVSAVKDGLGIGVFDCCRGLYTGGEFTLSTLLLDGNFTVPVCTIAQIQVD